MQHPVFYCECGKELVKTSISIHAVAPGCLKNPEKYTDDLYVCSGRCTGTGRVYRINQYTNEKRETSPEELLLGNRHLKLRNRE